MGCRLCGYCGMFSVGDDLFDGHDHCTANLPGVLFACCGHGKDRQAYVMFEDGLTVYGKAAVSAMEMIGGSPPTSQQRTQPYRGESYEAHLKWLVSKH